MQKINEIQYLLKDTKQIQKRYGTVVLYHCDNITCRLADSSLPDLGRDERRLVPQKVMACSMLGREDMGGNHLDEVRLSRWHRVPDLWRPKVMIVDREEVLVLSVEAEARSPAVHDRFLCALA